MPLFDAYKSEKRRSTLLSNALQAVPYELRIEFEKRAAQENAVRVIYGFVVAAISNIAYLLIGWRRMMEGAPDLQPAHYWLFYSRLTWWIVACIPVYLVWNWSNIRSGNYPLRRLQLLIGIALIWTWALALMRAALNFQFNQALGYYAVVMLVGSIFILPFRVRSGILLVSALVMSAAVIYDMTLTKEEVRYWIISVAALTLTVFVFSTVWYNGMARQFIAEKILDTQRLQLSEQSERLSTQNQIIEQDKAVLARQLESSRRQLNAFALRLAKTSNLLDGIKSDIENINTPRAEDMDKKKRLLRKIEQENTREDDWVQFREQFEQVYPRFFSAVLEQYPTLNHGELRLLSLLKMNLGTQEIADILGISAQSLNTARYRLRKHLGLTTEESLTEFVYRFK